MDIDGLLTYIGLRSLNNLKKEVKSRENDGIAIFNVGLYARTRYDHGERTDTVEPENQTTILQIMNSCFYIKYK